MSHGFLAHPFFSKEKSRYFNDPDVSGDSSVGVATIRVCVQNGNIDCNIHIR